MLVFILSLTSYYISSRDRTYFYDEQVKKYRSIGLCYNSTKGNINCDLAIRTSDDEMGLEWNSKPKALRRFPTTKDGEPECPQLFLMNDRWYLCAGISKQSDHGVGGISYWFGEKGQTIDEINWDLLPVNYLDGEDLCVPQIEKVKDRYYMFGWIPQQYNKTNWGGYKNLAREVYQLEDETLASRIDSEASLRLNRGKYFDITKNNIIHNNTIYEDQILTFSSKGEAKFNKKIGTSFVKFKVDMLVSTEFSFIINQNNYNDKYYLTIKKTSEGIFIEVKDNLEYVSSSVYLCASNITIFDVKAVIEGGIIEFCVNDLKVLTVRTKMTTKDYYPSFESNGKCNISSISFNRLAQIYDVYD